ncbi:unnamed protein product, partial [Adineta steineri]
SKTNETIIPGNPDRIKAKWDPLQYLNLAQYLKVFNEYPRDFNARVHGPYCPWRYYGKRDLHFGDVKVGDIPAWIARRDKTPMGIYQGGIRTFWKFYRAYLDNKRPNLIWYTQIFVVASLFNFVFFAIPDRIGFVIGTVVLIIILPFIIDNDDDEDDEDESQMDEQESKIDSDDIFLLSDDEEEISI